MYLILIGIICALCAPLHAQLPSQPAFESQAIMNSGSSYSGTVYEPFNASAPSEQNAENGAAGAAKAPSGPRRSFIDGPETGQSNESPIGEPWILLAFAAAMAVGITVKRKHANHKS